MIDLPPTTGAAERATSAALMPPLHGGLGAKFVAGEEEITAADAADYVGHFQDTGVGTGQVMGGSSGGKAS